MQYKDDETFEFQGAFSSEGKAIDACIDWNYGIGSCNLDEEISSQSEDWEDFYYPKAIV